jgi:hypothetical protein
MLRSKFKLARKFLLISFLLLDLVAILNGPIGRRLIPFRQGDCVVEVD